MSYILLLYACVTVSLCIYQVGMMMPCSLQQRWRSCHHANLNDSYTR